jgi:hypothetical protein
MLLIRVMLQSMQTNHPEDAPGHDIVETALDRMVAIAMYINEMKRRHERMLRTQELQNMLSGAQSVELAAYGDLVLEVSYFPLVYSLESTYSSSFSSS